jgi:hypothetical protein
VTKKDLVKARVDACFNEIEGSVFIVAFYPKERTNQVIKRARGVGAGDSLLTLAWVQRLILDEMAKHTKTKICKKGLKI